MASNYSANQFESAFASNYLRNWCVAKDSRKHPEAHDGYTQIIANDRGHLLPSVPRSQTSPWGTFMGTWQMPLQIPPARVTLTSRSTTSAKRLINWVHKNPDLLNASNGLRPEIRGHPQDSGSCGIWRSPRPPGKSATPKALQEAPRPASAENPPPSRGVPDVSPVSPDPPAPNLICSSSSTTSSPRSLKSSPISPRAAEGRHSFNEHGGQEIQERNIEHDHEEPQKDTGTQYPMSP